MKQASICSLGGNSNDVGVDSAIGFIVGVVAGITIDLSFLVLADRTNQQFVQEHSSIDHPIIQHNSNEKTSHNFACIVTQVLSSLHIVTFLILTSQEQQLN